MASSTEQIIVELLLDTSTLDSALAELEKSGQVDKATAQAFKNTTDAIRKQGQEAKKTAQSTIPLKKGLDDVAKATKSVGASFSKGVQEGITDALEEAGVSAEEFGSALQDALDKGDKATKSLRQELKETVQEIARLKVNDEVVPQELIERAGAIKDAMADANSEIANAGSDTRGLDNLLGSVQAVAGGFSVVQGAAALFGDESEELQKVLLRVNATMAILQGLQAVSNALEKEGAITLLLSNTQRKIQNAQLAIQTALESKSVVVRGLAIVAQKALNVAMASNPIGLVVVAVAALVSALTFYSRVASDAERQTGELNAALNDAGEGFEKSATNIRNVNQILLDELAARGAKQSDILKAQATAEETINANRVTQRKALEKQIAEAATSSDSDVRKAAIEASAELRRIDQDEFDARIEGYKRTIALTAQLRKEDLENAVAAAEQRALLTAEGSPAQLAAQKAAIDARLALELEGARDSAEETKKLQTQADKDKLELQVNYNKRILDLRVKDIENQLILTREGTEEEYILRGKLLKAQARAELESTKLSAGERLRIKEKLLQDEALLDRSYAEATRKRAIENEISKNAAVIAQLQINEEDKLALQVENIGYAAQLEVDAALGNADKIKEINAKRDADIRNTKIQYLNEAAQYEASLTEAQNGVIVRALQKRAAGANRETFKQRKAAVAQLSEIELDAIGEEEKLNRKKYEQNLISYKEYDLARAQLSDKRKAREEMTEQEITDLTREQNKQRVDIILGTAEQLSGIFSMLSEAANSNATNEINARRNQLDQLKAAGAITEKEAIERAKRIDAEERKIKRQAAIREKQLAIFNAVISTARGVAAAIPNPYLIALAAAVGAAQVAIIASKQIPQFATGKTSLYEGIAKVGETGAAELVERNGRLFVADKPTITYLGKNDKVYSPHDTRKMLANTHQVDGQIIKYQSKQKQQDFDYDKQAAAIAKHIKSLPTTNVSLDKDGLNIWVKQGQDAQKYWTNRYKTFGK